MSPFTAITFLLALTATAFAAPTSEGPASIEKRARTGRGTWFDVGLGACGETNVNSDKIIAISADIYGNGGYCGKVRTCLTPLPCLSSDLLPFTGRHYHQHCQRQDRDCYCP